MRILQGIATDDELTSTERDLYTQVMMKRPPTLKALKAEIAVCYTNLIRYYRHLEQLGWIKTSASTGKRQLMAVVPEDVETRIAAEILGIINVSPYKGELTAKFAVEWIVAPGITIIHNARPDFMKKTKDSQPLELDIFLPDWMWAGEYQGDQHSGLTKMYSDEKAFIARIGRDQLKVRLCRENGIRLSAITKHDLSLTGIDELLPREIPRRTYNPNGPFSHMIDKLGKEIAATEHRDRE